MSEPGTVTFVITGVAAAALGPVLGPYVLIVFAAVVGSLLAMSRTPLDNRAAGVKFIVVGVLVALVLTGPCVWAVQTYTTVPGHVALVPMAFVLGAARTGVLSLMDKSLDACGAALGVLLNALAARKGDGK
jgi:hypothetical protein